MANPNVDSDFDRGYYQHRRTYHATVNGDGQPLASDLLEGEIAINLSTSKMYTKKNVYVDVDYTAIVDSVQTNSGVLFDFTPISSAYIGQKIGIIFNSDTKTYYTIDSDDTSAVGNFITGLQSHLSTNHTTVSTVNGTALGAFGKTSQLLVHHKDSDEAISFVLDSDFIRYIDHTRVTVSRIIQTSAVDHDVFTHSATVTPTSFIMTYSTAGSVKSITSSAVPLYSLTSSSENSYFVTNMNISASGINAGTDNIRASIDQNQASLLDLTASIPNTSNTPPAVAVTSSKPGINGDLWIQPPGAQNDSEPTNLFWLDLSVKGSSRAQAKARLMNDSDRTSQGIVAYDSDGSGNLNYAEWRQVTSGSFLIPQNFGVVSEIKTFDSESVHTFNGTLDVRNGTLKMGSRFEFANETFTKLKRFSIVDVNNAVQFSMVGFDSDG
jgi:hypothetical protein|tara:strand:- start:11147 stop:12460 length:1314 start_codon:yes stop_codon:yes gene_type:complete